MIDTHTQGVMVNFMCKLIRAMGCPDIWLNITLGVSQRPFLDETQHPNWTTGHPPHGGPSNPLSSTERWSETDSALCPTVVERDVVLPSLRPGLRPELQRQLIWVSGSPGSPAPGLQARDFSASATARTSSS